MSNTRSESSSESISIYETPINSPSNDSLIDSTRIDSSLFGNTSANTQSIDLLDFRQSFESIPTSAATESTLRQTVQRLNSECSEDRTQTTHEMNVNPSIWLSSQSMSSLRNQLLDSNRSDILVVFSKYMSDLESEQLELIGVEQQIQSLSLKCRTIRENMISKTNAINSLITEIIPKKKQSAQKQTQTEPQNIKESNSYSDQTIFKPLNTEVFQKLNVSEPKLIAKTVSTENKFCELSENLKKRLNRLPAMVKGYLTRRLMKTEKVLQKIDTIRDTTQLLSNYRNNPTNKAITEEDVRFHKRLIIQLESSCHELYDIFFNYPKSSQMALIRRSRQHILDRHYRTVSVLSNSSYLNESFQKSNKKKDSTQSVGVSAVTKKVMQRKTKNKTNGSQLSSSHSRNSMSSSETKIRSVASGAVRLSNERVISCVRRSNRNAVQTHKRKANFDNK